MNRSSKFLSITLDKDLRSGGQHFSSKCDTGHLEGGPPVLFKTKQNNTSIIPVLLSQINVVNAQSQRWNN